MPSQYIQKPTLVFAPGVVLTGSLSDYTLAVDHEATEALRGEMNVARQAAE